MRKTFKFICAAVVAAFAVSSCYDDSKLWTELEELDQRVTALEEKLNSDVATLNGLISTLDGKVKELTAADENLLAKLTALNTQVDGAVKDAKAAKEAAAAVKDLTAQLDALDGTVDGLVADLEDAIKKLDAADGELDGKLEKLAGELKGLSADFAEEIAKIAVVNVENQQDGSVVLTLADGSKLTVGAPAKNADNTNLITVIEGEWHVVLADGTTKPIDVPVGVEDLRFRVNVSTSELEFSVNGGEYVSTGVVVKDPEAYNHIVEGFTEDDEFVTFTIGGKRYALPLYVAKTDAVLLVKSGKTYFDFETSIEFDLSIAEVEEYYVIAKPDGWRAKVSNGVLTVTSPAEALVTAGTAEAEGQVLLHANTVDGQCRMASLVVSTIPGGFTMSINETGTLHIVNPVVYTVESEYGPATSSFAEVYIGLAPISAFEKSPVSYVNSLYNGEIEGEATNLTNLKHHYDLGGNYNAEEYYDDFDDVTYPQYLVDEFDLTVAQIYNHFNYANPPKGSQFVVFAVPYNETNSTLLMDDMVYMYYAPVEVVATKKSDKFNEVEIEVEVFGTSTYYVGIANPMYMGEADVDTYMQDSQGPFGMLQRAVMMGMPQYAFSNMGTLYENTGAETIRLSDLNYGEQLSPGTEYYVWVFPVVDGKDLSTYTYEQHFKPYIYTYQTPELTSGGSATVLFEEEPKNQTYTSVEINATASDDAALIYYYAYDPEILNEIADLTADLLANGVVTTNSTFTLRSGDNRELKLEAGSPVVFAALAVDSEGKYGTPVQTTCKTKELVINNDLNATITASAYTYTNNGGTKFTTVYLKVETDNSNLKSIRYFCDLSSRFNVDQNALAYSTGTEQSVTYLTNGYFKLTYREAGAEYKLGYVCIDTDGCASEYKEITFTTPADNSVISASQATPETTVYNPESKEYSTNNTGSINKVGVTVNLPEGSMAWWAMNNDIVEDNLVLDFVTGNESDATFFAGTKTHTFNCGASKTGYKFYLVIMDANGNFTYFIEDIDAFINANKSQQ